MKMETYTNFSSGNSPVERIEVSGETIAIIAKTAEAAQRIAYLLNKGFETVVEEK